MSLYDVTHKPDRLITAEDCEEYEPIQKIVSCMNKKTLDSNLRFIDKILVDLQPSKLSNLIYTKTGILFGHMSQQNKMKVDRLWEKVIEVVGDGPECLMTIGGLLRWRIALDTENTWLLWVEDTGQIEDLSGKKIKISNYWIDNHYQIPKQNTAQDLANLFNTRI